MAAGGGEGGGVGGAEATTVPQGKFTPGGGQFLKTKCFWKVKPLGGGGCVLVACQSTAPRDQGKGRNM